MHRIKSPHLLSSYPYYLFFVLRFSHFHLQILPFSIHVCSRCNSDFICKCLRVLISICCKRYHIKWELWPEFSFSLLSLSQIAPSHFTAKKNKTNKNSCTESTEKSRQTLCTRKSKRAAMNSKRWRTWKIKKNVRV